MPSHRKPRKVPTNAPEERIEGTIIAHHGVAVKVALDENSIRPAVTSTRPIGKEREKEGEGKHVLVVKVRPRSGHVVGDRVKIVGERLERLPRERALIRRHPGGGVHTLAAHLDVVAVVVASHPELKPGLADRAIVSARACGIEPVVVVNKIELEGAEKFIAEMKATFESSLRVILASAYEKTGLDELAKLFREAGRGVFVGPSGVGKSSLLNAMLPSAHLLIGEVSAATGKGRHTTVVATLHELESGGELVDTPGLRDFGLVHVEPVELAQYFAGFEEILESPCRFRDCLHEREPGCVVLDAVATGVIGAERLKTYHALLHELQDEQARARSGRAR